MSGLPKSEWGPGPWQDEPDRVEWRHAGLPCLARRGPLGNWCGYAAVPPGHPFHGVSAFGRDGLPVEVHGGLTYASECDGDEGEGICHGPQPGEPAEVWWFGFDCGHCDDRMPAMEASERRYGWAPEKDYGVNDLWRPTYKPLAYVTAETNHLAEQLAALTHSAAASAGSQATS